MCQEFPFKNFIESGMPLKIVTECVEIEITIIFK